MEMMPHHDVEAVDAAEVFATRPSGRVPLPVFGPDVPADWRHGLPTLASSLCTLREMRREDAPSLFAHLTTEEVARFISPPPTSVRGFEAFIAWAHRQRARGRYACFGIVPAGLTHAVGMFQVRVPDDGHTAEWGFVLGSAYWGSGIFLAGAQRVLEFAFVDLDVDRLEARSALQNGRGNGALRKVGAVRETVLPGAFERHGERLDQALWVIAREAWEMARRALRYVVH
ncbi:MAG: GNAT family N-acetyltransferase [Vicinamibacterales bacterium]